MSTRGTLLELWRPPATAGEPLGCLTTTYTFDPAFFEEECLSRFLEVDTVPGRSNRLAYVLDRDTRLEKTYAGVLADIAMAGVEHAWRWDVLPVRVPRGIQHAKLTLLAWQGALRIIIASANCTPSGYRTNQEVFGCIDCTPFAHEAAAYTACREFIDRLCTCVPDSGEERSPLARARAFLALVDARVREWTEVATRGKNLVVLPVFSAPGTGTKEAAQTLADCIAHCRSVGRAPRTAYIASPFFNDHEHDETDAPTAKLIELMDQNHAEVTLCLPRAGENSGTVTKVAAPKAVYTTLLGKVNKSPICLLPERDEDDNTRIWHAKMLRFADRDRYEAHYVGSANWTSAGMGIGARINFEAGLLYLCKKRKYDRNAGQLARLWSRMSEVPDPATIRWMGAQSITEEMPGEQQAVLPGGFVSAVYAAGDNPELRLSFAPEALPAQWQISSDRAEAGVLLDSILYAQRENQENVCLPWRLSDPPCYLLVAWENQTAYWTLNIADDRVLPAAPELGELNEDQLIAYLAAVDPGAVLRAALARASSSDDEEIETVAAIDLDPLRRYDLQATFLHRVRRWARQFARIRARLEEPVASVRILESNLRGIIGIRTLVRKLAANCTDPNHNRVESILVLADFLLMLTMVHYRGGERALSRRSFTTAYRTFLGEVADEAEAAVRTVSADLDTELAQFWQGVLQRCRA